MFTPAQRNLLKKLGSGNSLGGRISQVTKEYQAELRSELVKGLNTHTTWYWELESRNSSFSKRFDINGSRGKSDSNPWLVVEVDIQFDGIDPRLLINVRNLETRKDSRTSIVAGSISSVVNRITDEMVAPIVVAIEKLFSDHLKKTRR